MRGLQANPPPPTPARPTGPTRASTPHSPNPSTIGPGRQCEAPAASRHSRRSVELHRRRSIESLQPSESCGQCRRRPQRHSTGAATATVLSAPGRRVPRLWEDNHRDPSRPFWSGRAGIPGPDSRLRVAPLSGLPWWHRRRQTAAAACGRRDLGYRHGIRVMIRGSRAVPDGDVLAVTLACGRIMMIIIRVTRVTSRGSSLPPRPA